MLITGADPYTLSWRPGISISITYKGVMRFGRLGKLSMMCIRPFEILRRVGDVVYELALLLAFLNIQPIFMFL